MQLVPAVPKHLRPVAAGTEEGDALAATEAAGDAAVEADAVRFAPVAAGDETAEPTGDAPEEAAGDAAVEATAVRVAPVELGALREGTSTWEMVCTTALQGASRYRKAVLGRG